MTNLIFLILIITLLAVIILPWWLNRKTPQPPYKVLSKDGAIEKRQYNDMLLATTPVSHNRSYAIQVGFKRLASYIFGNHRSTDSKNIPMTAPVIQQKKQPGKPSPIGMTAPVIQQKNSDSALDQDSWEIAFIMPKKFTQETIPQPNDTNITLKKQPGHQVLAIQFTGLISNKKIEQKISALKEYAKKHNITVSSEPTLAFYDPPWIFPWLKRHEVWLLISPPKKTTG